MWPHVKAAENHNNVGIFNLFSWPVFSGHLIHYLCEVRWFSTLISQWHLLGYKNIPKPSTYTHRFWSHWSEWGLAKGVFLQPPPVILLCDWGWEPLDSVIWPLKQPCERSRGEMIIPTFQRRKLRSEAVRRFGHDCIHYVSVRAGWEARSLDCGSRLASSQCTTLTTSSDTSQLQTRPPMRAQRKNSQDLNISLHRNSQKCTNKYKSLLTRIMK